MYKLNEKMKEVSAEDFWAEYRKILKLNPAHRDTNHLAWRKYGDSDFWFIELPSNKVFAVIMQRPTPDSPHPGYTQTYQIIPAGGAK